MSSQDELRQMGSGNSVVVDEPMVQDANPMQELSPQTNPEVVLGRAEHERPLQQTSLPVPSESTATGSFDVREMFEALMGEMKMNRQKMDANMHTMENRLRDDMQTQRGEMQSMGLGLQTGLDGMKSIMAAPHGSDTEPTRGSVECVRTAMETGKVG